MVEYELMVEYGLMGLGRGLGGTRLGTIHETTVYIRAFCRIEINKSTSQRSQSPKSNTLGR